MSVSVVVPSYNSRQTIRECLRSLVQQTLQPDEIIVVDSSSDETPEMIRNEFPQVTLIHLNERTLPGKARNIGARRVKTKYVAFIDADVVVKPDWLEVMTRHLDEHPEHVAVTGTIGVANPGNIWGLVGYMLEFSEFIPGAGSRELLMAPSANIIVRRQALLEAGGFPEGFYPGEDTVWTWRLREQGQTWLLAGTGVYHWNREGWKNVLRHIRRLGETFVASRAYDRSLPGAFVLDKPWLVPILSLVKWCRVAGRLLRYDRKLFGVYLLLSPLVFWGLMVYTAGIREALQSLRLAEGGMNGTESAVLGGGESG